MARQDTVEIKFTPTQEKILEILSDGQRHTRKELHQVCHPQSLPSIVWQHVSIIRKKLELKEETIVCEYYNKLYYYRHVRLLAKKG